MLYYGKELPTEDMDSVIRQPLSDVLLVLGEVSNGNLPEARCLPEEIRALGYFLIDKSSFLRHAADITGMTFVFIQDEHTLSALSALANAASVNNGLTFDPVEARALYQYVVILVTASQTAQQIIDAREEE
jgi:hypothetical protein